MSCIIRVILAASTLLAFAPWTSVAAGQCRVEGISATPTGTLSKFGWQLELTGDTLLASDPYRQVAATSIGAVFVWERNGATWEPRTWLTRPANATEAFFGYSLTRDGTDLFVGAPKDPAGGGSGRVFHYVQVAGGWTLDQSISSASVTQGAEFGHASALANGRLFVGARLDSTGGPTDAGAVLVFENNGTDWVEVDRLVPPTPERQFGWNVVADGDRVAVTSFRNAGGGGVSGAVHVFVENGTGWVHEGSVQLAIPYALDGFGTDMDLDADRLLVGAPDDHRYGFRAGSVSLFERDTQGWSHVQDLIPLGVDGGDGLGVAVEFHGGTAVIAGGTVNAGVTHNAGPGVVWTFERDVGTGSWVETQRLWNPIAADGDMGVLAMGLDGDLLVTSEPNGALIQIFDLDGCVGATTCDAVPNSQGHRAELLARGSDVVVDLDLTIESHGLPSGSFTFLLVGSDPGYVAGPGGSSGDLCLSGSIGRFLPPRAVNSSGAASWLVDLTALPQPTGSIPIVAGQSWFFQAWYRDVPSTSNFTNATWIDFR